MVNPFSRKRILLLISSLFLALTIVGLIRVRFPWRPERHARRRNITELATRVGHIQFRRQRLLQAACRHGNDRELPPEKLDHVIVDDEHKLLYCFVPKVASTNWKRVLLSLRENRASPLTILANQSHDPHAFRTLSQLSSADVRYRLQHYLKFFFIRHPYERLLSAYRNKFEHAWSDYFPKRFGRKIVRTYRSDPSAESLESGADVTFQEFLSYVSDLDVSDDSAAFNEHWRPVSDLCFPCQLHYDVIGAYNTLEDDSNYVLWLARLHDVVSFPTRNATYSSEPTRSLMARYYSSISTDTLRRLEKVYEMDLGLFEDG
ncbi:carbohydrate sulfotransferase 11-like [Ornithodoros turicata]|uniref:carbohydrate sulfotransferase 11-like n=1 Tax=Ornithodoros turicata TaxID=34597 RepID=UPI0031397B94